MPTGRAREPRSTVSIRFLGKPNPMAQVLRLKGRIAQVRKVDAGETVGYGATHRVAGNTRLAVVAFGYADGLLRSLSNRGHGILERVPSALVGRISMDLITFDTSGDVPEAQAPILGALIELIRCLQSRR